MQDQWYDNFDKIEYESDGQNDYWDDMQSELVERDEDMRNQRLSSSWVRGRMPVFENPERVVYDLIQVRDVVAGLLRIHGVPKRTKIELACLGQVGKGAATFEDIGVWNKPVLMLDAEIYKTCKPEEMLDVYCGVGLHEASHLNHTRRAFERMQNGTLSGQRQMWEGLWEDERIEDKVRQESPGYAGYLQAAKRALFENQEFGNVLSEWNSTTKVMSDMDRLNCLVFGFIRCGHLMTDEMKNWRTLAGRHAFQELRDMFPHIPATEEEVEKYGKLLMDWIASHRKDMSDITEAPNAVQKAKDMQATNNPPGDSQGEQAGQQETSDGGGDPQDSDDAGDLGEDSNDDGTEAEATGQTGGMGEGEIQDRVDQQVADDMQDATTQETMEAVDKAIDQLIRNHQGALQEYEDTKSVGESNSYDKDAIAEYEKDKKELESKKTQIEKSLDRDDRFGIAEIVKMLKRMDTVNTPLNAAESEAIASAEELRVKLGPDWKPDQSSADKASTIIVHPTVTDAGKKKYKAYYDSVKKEVARMRKALSFRIGQRTIRQTELREGQFNRRMLGRAMSTDRLFQKKTTITDPGVGIAVLLDESGSMSSAPHTPQKRNTKAQRALQVGVLLIESLDRVPGVELELYSFTTRDRNTYFKNLYGKDNKKKEAIADYGTRGAGNYDFAAIHTAQDLMHKNMRQDKKLLIVVSDGAPCGSCNGRSARECTKIAVDQARKGGVDVLQIAIDDFEGSEYMYGDKNTIQFKDATTLIQDMSKFVRRVVKQA